MPKAIGTSPVWEIKTALLILVDEPRLLVWQSGCGAVESGPTWFCAVRRFEHGKLGT